MNTKILSKAMLAGAVLSALIATEASAQTAPPVRVRGTVEMVHGDELMVKSRDGKNVSIKLAPDYSVTGVVKASLVAKRFAAEGAHVVLIARTVGGLEEVDDAIRAAGGSATLLPLDLMDGAKIDQIGPSLHQRFGRCDIFVGNAAMLGPLSPIGHIDARDWDRMLAVNLTANWRLMRTLDPLLRIALAGRVILVTCAVTTAVHPYWGAYAASKAALETLALTYAGEVTKTPVRVNALDPGIVRTKLRKAAFPVENQEGLRAPEDVTEAFVTLASPECTRHGEIVRI